MRESFSGKSKGKERASIFSLSSGDVRQAAAHRKLCSPCELPLCHSEARTGTSGTHVPTLGSTLVTVRASRSSSSGVWVSLSLSSSAGTSPSCSPPPRFIYFFFCKKEKCQFELPAWQTPQRNQYGPDKVVFISLFCCEASQVRPSLSPPSFQYFPIPILPVADNVTGNVCSEMLVWWQAADKKV